MRRLLSIALALLVCLALTQSASAQYGRRGAPSYGPGYRPNLSPFLNLLRNQSNANAGGLAADYYLGTRIEQQRRYNSQEFRTRLGDLELRDQVTVPTTGTAPARGGYFNNTMGFYNNTGRAGTGR